MDPLVSPHPDAAALVLAGGGGTRLWPLSSPTRPKPLIPSFPGEGPCLLIQTLDRIAPLIAPSRTFIITNDQQAPAIEQVLGSREIGGIICEPAPRNTAAAIAYAMAWVQAHRKLTPLWAVFPADHCVRQVKPFQKALGRGLWLAQNKGQLVTLGIEPNFPSTQYGYIEYQADKQADPGALVGVSFTEKPSQDRASAWLAQGNYLWNAGIFLGAHQQFAQELARSCPQTWSSVQRCVAHPEQAGAVFATLRAQPFDRAVMEKLTRFGVVKLEAGWSDVGAWNRAAQELARDDNDNACVNVPGAQTAIFASSGCSVWNHGRKVAVVGVKDLIVVTDGDQLLITHKDQTSSGVNLARLFDQVERANSPASQGAGERDQSSE